MQCSEAPSWAGALDWLVNRLLPPLIVGVVVAGLGSFLLARANEVHKGRRNHVVESASEVLKCLSELQELASEYWSSGQQNLSNAALLESKIEYRIALLAVLIETSREIWKIDQAEIRSLYQRLVGSIVTEEFGTPQRVAASDRGRLASSVAAAIADHVITGRRDFVRTDMQKRKRLGRA